MRTSYMRSFALLLAAAALGIVGCSEGSDAPAPAKNDESFTTGPKLAFDEYTVLFTNPVCKKYSYAKDTKVLSNGGKELTEKPQNVYCTPSDGAASADRDSSPQKKLIEWIRDEETKEIFFAYLSFSNRVVAGELCKAIQERNVKVTMVLDRETDLNAAKSVLDCKPGSGDPAAKPRLELRGHDATIGFAHNKVFMVNPRSDRPRIVFSSGNLSSGVVLHHENWHFLRVPARTHFAKAHVCLMDGMLDHFRTKDEYKTFIKTCRDASPLGEESDLKTFFVPGDGNRASAAVRDGIRTSSFIGINAHRFSFKLIRTELEDRLSGPNPPRVQLTVDDDIWWAGHGNDTVPNTRDEFEMLEPLVKAGVDVRYLETNHRNGLLHHNKFMVFEGAQGTSIFAGAGNFTGTAFTDNFENFYVISVPHIVEAMKEQQQHLFGLGTAEEDLPAEDIAPETN
jgi:hypothetical protein